MKTELISKNYSNPGTFFLTTHAKEIKWILLNILFFSLGTVGSLGISYYLGRIIDVLTTGGNINIPMILLVSMLFGHEICYRIGHILEVLVDTRIRQRTKKTLFAHTAKLSFGYFTDHFAGQISHQIGTAATALERMNDIVIEKFIDITWMFIISIIALSLVYLPLGIIVVVWVLFFIVGLYPFVKKLNVYSEDFASNESQSTGTLVDMYTNIATVKVYSKDFDQSRVYHQVDQEYNAQRVLGKWSIFTYAYQGFSAAFLACALIIMTGYGYVHGLITLGGIVLISGIGLKILSDVYEAGHSVSEFIRSYGECSQALKDILVEPAIDNGKNHIIDPWKSVAVKYQQVTFSYDHQKEILKNFSLVIPVGQKIGIVGLSGAGKTTMMNLLLRFFDPQKGKIIMNDVDITTLTQESLRSHISFISQDTSLFHTTISENIQYGSPLVPRSKIEEVARMAYGNEFITTLPKGYDTIVGERGVKLSGGQRQRIAIARAMLKNSPLFLLDEATSALDSDSESKVQEALKILMQGKTVIAIAHRLSTLQYMDRIVFIENGKIVEDGTHEELLALQGKYATLWSMQAGGFLPPSV